jgi:hypothetical protein
VNDYNQLLILLLLLLLLTTATSTAAASDGAVIFCDIFLINQSHYCALVGVSIIVPIASAVLVRASEWMAPSVLFFFPSQPFLDYYIFLFNI